jgi:hypothetical protein
LRKSETSTQPRVLSPHKNHKSPTNTRGVKITNDDHDYPDPCLIPSIARTSPSANRTYPICMGRASSSRRYLRARAACNWRELLGVLPGFRVAEHRDRTPNLLSANGSIDPVIDPNVTVAISETPIHSRLRRITPLTQVSARAELDTMLPRRTMSYVAVPRHSYPPIGTHKLGSLARFVRSVLARPRGLECSAHMKSTIGVVAQLRLTAVVKILLPGITIGPPTLAALEHRERFALVRRNKQVSTFRRGRQVLISDHELSYR